MSRKAIADMLGGVDSSVAAWLLKQQGYDVIDITMQIQWDESTDVQEAEGGCCGLNAVDDACRVVMNLGIPHYVMNFREEFRKNVMGYFVGEYVEGKIPNPCIVCNRYVKRESLLRCSMAIGAGYIVIGHYAQTEQLSNDRCIPRTSVTVGKDQIYIFYNLTQDQLAHILMSMGSFCKDEMCRMAWDVGLQAAHKPDSQEICSIPDHDYAGLIEGYTGRQMPEGSPADLQGNVLGRHEGVSHCITGQRKGLNLSAGRPVFAVEVRPEVSKVVTGGGKDVLTNVLCRSKLNWMVVDGSHGRAIEVIVETRYSHKGTPCTIREINPDLAKCMSHEPV